MELLLPVKPFSSLKTFATLESVNIFKELMENYRNGLSEEDLEFTKNALIKSNARRFETLGALLGMLQEISEYDLPFDYVKQEEAFIKGLDFDAHKELAQKYIVPDKMYYVVVGDAETQMPPLKEVGFGDPELFNE